ncbi:hypothetical protein [Acinetobacter sp. PK01]|uniref:hypothetical protein n=1 Tax=Acinetobacter sp. PK01 TaxID=2930198 RepID=UPI001FB74213|nr:hypothetical protein [Acinetobacter sp. PK01]UOG16878.1 hypothetical protein MP622_10175 [Acinetobacter sp. PK01]
MYILHDLAKLLISIAMIVFSISAFAQNIDSEQKDSKKVTNQSNQQMNDKRKNESILNQSKEQMVKTDVVLSDEQIKAYRDSIRVLLESR